MIIHFFTKYRNIDAVCETQFDVILFKFILEITSFLLLRKSDPQCYQMFSIRI